MQKILCVFSELSKNLVFDFRTGPVKKRLVRSYTSKEAYGSLRFVPEQRGPRPASEEGKLELTEALRSYDRS